MTDFLVALGLVLVLEGLLYALFPGAMKRMVMLVLTMPDEAIRRSGLVALALGVVIVWLVRV
ncbi:MAG: DUF2065 domain-containing protein [Alphaproteobacteria bacterium]|jgi:uncharacterized protein YjeT (DUF2065 family)|nr:hypothetical protein [Rhodobiaceae bacterium]MBO6543531.1 DUF2065 domain-containing protein [Alphaproteobacteria bacterium]MBO6627396.1 DUF2065 domain-containing protein [Alphaproteobacteria bacterium]MDF1626968.1 DUF2065 family protein [Parvibaculaceae bacterium]|tara:strand:- start:257 stop:442 length:186 start_codon:yes stop_codon:yes gene_type:complete